MPESSDATSRLHSAARPRARAIIRARVSRGRAQRFLLRMPFLSATDICLLVTGRILMRAFAPPRLRLAARRVGDISPVNYGREREGRENSGENLHDVYGAGADRCQAESNETPRCAERSAPLAGARDLLRTAPGTSALVVNVILHARARGTGDP